MAVDDTDLVYKVNQMLRRSGVRDSVSSLSQCTSEIFLILYEILTGSVINCDDVASELEKCSVIVHCLQAFLDVDLSHIEGSALACRQVETIRDLLNVFVELCASREGVCDEDSLLAGSSPQLHSSPNPVVMPCPDTYTSLEYQPLIDVTSSGASQNSGSSEDRNNILSHLYQNYLEELSTEEKLHTRTDDDDGSLFQPLMGEFPEIHISSPTSRLLHQKQRLLTRSLHSQAKSLLSTTVSKKLEEVQRKQLGLRRLLEKDLRHAIHMQKHRLEQERSRALRQLVHTDRMASARARKYFRDYELELKKKLQVPRTSEEQTFIKTFEKNMKMLQENTRAKIKSIKEKQVDMEEKLSDHLDAVENCCKGQFARTGEKEKEKREPFSQIILKHKKLKEMEEEVVALQDAVILRRPDVQHFREVDASSLKLPLQTPRL